MKKENSKIVLWVVHQNIDIVNNTNEIIKPAGLEVIALKSFRVLFNRYNRQRYDYTKVDVILIDYPIIKTRKNNIRRLIQCAPQAKIILLSDYNDVSFVANELGVDYMYRGLAALNDFLKIFYTHSSYIKEKHSNC